MTHVYKFLNGSDRNPLLLESHILFSVIHYKTLLSCWHKASLVAFLAMQAIYLSSILSLCDKFLLSTYQ